MALKEKLAAKLTPVFCWQLGLGVAGAVCLALFIVVWLSGSSETQDASETGRRLLIRLDTGAIEGKQITIEPPVTAPEESPTPTPTATDTPTPTTSATPEVPVPPSDSAAAPTPTPVASPQTPSATPVATTAETPKPAPAASVTTSPPADKMSDSIKPAAVSLAAVNADMLEKSAEGALPKIGPDGAKPWHYYAKTYVRKGHLPMIAVIVSGMGQNKSVTEQAIKLPEEVTLSFSPYARDLASWANSARIAGHEIMLDLPMQPSNYPAADPGPYGLLVGKGVQDNAQRLQWLMSRAEGYTGFITTPQDEIFSANDKEFRGLLSDLEHRGLMLAVGHAPAADDTRATLDGTKTASVIGDVAIDEELSATAIAARLASLEKIAAKRGFAVGVAQAYPLTVQQLAAWSAQLDKEGFVLVPVTFITAIKFAP